jgi:hypothetical protein
VFVYVRAPVERLEEEASKISLKKKLLDGGGLAPFAIASRQVSEQPLFLALLTDYSQVKMQGLQYKSVIFLAGRNPGASKGCAQVGSDRAGILGFGVAIERFEAGHRGERIFIELMKSERKLEASREGSR